MHFNKVCKPSIFSRELVEFNGDHATGEVLNVVAHKLCCYKLMRNAVMFVQKFPTWQRKCMSWLDMQLAFVVQVIFIILHNANFDCTYI